MSTLVEELKRRAANLSKEVSKELEKNVPAPVKLDVGSKTLLGDILSPLKEGKTKLEAKADGIRNQVTYLEVMLESIENLLLSSEEVIDEIESCNEMENISG